MTNDAVDPNKIICPDCDGEGVIGGGDCDNCGASCDQCVEDCGVCDGSGYIDNPDHPDADDPAYVNDNQTSLLPDPSHSPSNTDQENTK